ncbi:surfactin synthase thioesterase subunit [Kibdelosporangium banguiense]|uniref:Surfactin synthase thioesterase subunit n=1 Tax=Kibdelosporangium banguiense TaxID=1365924 RepID=A0ABS4TW68_9PSEU|nr:alpha/beta fold hydrolase [Kibdelosporangium banguiense]MBP2328653.1 surfactin synthase thioesterase subunit [Kibdelosporangium banguiense]
MWIRRFHRARPDAPRLVCFPHAGGSASYFVPLSVAMGQSVEVLAIQYPGRQDRFDDPPIGSVTRLADVISDELTDLLDKPLVLFGHSMGANVAFEVAHRLGAGVRHLVCSARLAPSRGQPATLDLTDDRALIQELHRLQGSAPGALDEEVMRLALPALRSDFLAVKGYRCPPDRRLSCPVTAFVGDDDSGVPVAEVQHWSGHTTDRFVLRRFPGGHHYLAHQWPTVADELLAVLAPVCAPTTTERRNDR